MDDELAYADVFALRGHPGTAEALVEKLLERIAAVDAGDSPTALRSVLAVSPTALDDARAGDRAVPQAGPGPGGHCTARRGPGEGQRHRGRSSCPSTAGLDLPSLDPAPPRAGAALVRRISAAAGAVVLDTHQPVGMGQHPLSAHSTSGWSAVGGLTANPWARDRSAGGSSSGSGFRG